MGSQNLVNGDGTQKSPLPIAVWNDKCIFIYTCHDVMYTLVYIFDLIFNNTAWLSMQWFYNTWFFKEYSIEYQVTQWSPPCTPWSPTWINFWTFSLFWFGK